MKRTHIYFLVLFGIISVTSVSARTTGFAFKSNVRSVKIDIDIQNNIILVPVRINGSFEMNFILDTGVRASMLLEPILAGFLELDSVQTVLIRGLGEGDPIKAPMAKDVTMELPGVIGKGLNLVVLPEGLISYSGMFGKQIHGIIGYDLFSQFVVEVNYNREFIRLYNPFKFKLKKSFQTVPIRILKGKPYVQAKYIDHTGYAREDSWLLDTGSSLALSLFSEEIKLPAKNVETYLGRGLNGDLYGKLGRIPRFEIGTFWFEDIVTGYPEPEMLGQLAGRINWYGNLGSEILSRFSVIFDYPRGQLYLKRGNKFREEFSYNISGVEIVSDGIEYDEYLIAYIRPNSPAANAGLQIRDQIMAINGVSTDKMDMDQIYGFLNKKSGRTLNMVLKRQNQTIRRKFKVLKEI